ncbi:MAG: ABC transporter ATP-binding protein [Planctomycetota bacterium]|jgi:putative ABC transport system ATP-binding protein
MPLVQATNLTRRYRMGTAEVQALRGVSLTVELGEVVALVGPSGSGKSTLLHLLAGLDRPSGGEVVVDGRALHRCSRDELARYRHETVGMVFQAFHLLPTFTAQRNVEVALAMGGVARRERPARAAALLERVGLAERAGHKPTELSGGEQQRVALARALANAPKLLLADEPTGNLDTATAAGVMELLLAPARAGTAALVMVTHNGELADQVADRVVRMQDGAIIDAGDGGGDGGGDPPAEEAAA